MNEDSRLDGIPGLGSAKRQRLVDHIGSVDAVLAASEEELTAVPGIGPELAARIVYSQESVVGTVRDVFLTPTMLLQGPRFIEDIGHLVAGEVPPDRSPSTSSSAEIFRRTVKSIRRRAGIAFVAGVVGLGAGWILNVLVMGATYDGFRVPSGSAATGQGNLVRGSIFYFLAGLLASGLVSYRLTVGRERFWRDVKELPASVRGAITADGDDTLLHVLVGFAGTMLVVIVIGRSISALFAVGLLLAFLGVLRPVVLAVAQRAWRAVAGRLAPSRSTPPPAVALLVGIVGAVGASIAGWLVTSRPAQLALAALAAAAAVAISRRGQTPGTPPAVLALLTIGPGVIRAVLGDAAAFADDGGFRECGNPGAIDYVFNCDGSVRVLLQSLIGGGATATGAALGATAGSDLPPDEDDKPEDERQGSGRPAFDRWDHWDDPEERQSRRNQYIAEFAEQQGTSDDLERVEEYIYSREQYDKTKAEFEVWREAYPGRPASEFWDFYSGETIDMGGELVELIMLGEFQAIAHAPGAVVRGGKAVLEGGKWVVKHGPDAARAGVATVKDVWASKQALKESKQALKEVKAYEERYWKGEELPPWRAYAVLHDKDPKMANAYLDTLSDTQLKSIYGKGLPQALEEVGSTQTIWKTSFWNSALSHIGDKGLPAQWHAQSVNAIADGSVIPSWVKSLPPDEIPTFARMFLDNNGPAITGPVPTIDDLVRMWSSVP